MNRKRKVKEGIVYPPKALADTIKQFPETIKDLGCPWFWMAFCCFIGVPCAYYWGTAVVFCLIPRCIWSIFFGA